ncbi:hypothetical protein EZS27_040614, partial [termite gut metagenome]
MNILSLFVVVPVLMIIALFLVNGMKAIRTVMVTGASILLVLAGILTVQFLQLRGAGVVDEMLFVSSTLWYAPLNIAYAVGVDGISVV